MIYVKKEGQKDEESFEEIDIVFCKNCKHWDTLWCAVFDEFYDRKPTVTKPDEYCAWGERKE